MQPDCQDGKQADDESVDLVCDRGVAVSAAIVELTAVEAYDDDGGRELQCSKGGTTVDACQTAFVPVLL